MEQYQYDTYCGLYCGACDVMATFKKSIENNRKPTWNELPSEMRKYNPSGKIDDIKCYGCKTDIVFEGCSKCPIRKCAKEKMNVTVCFDCSKFPCFRFRIFSLARWFMKNKLPHLKTIPKNRTMIQEKGITEWLVQQEATWKCPQCNSSFTWYMKVCNTCGVELESIKDFDL
jgi:hypothetical protein